MSTLVSARTVDMLEFERVIWNDGYRLIAGVDEVGRGALAGPLVAAAVILPLDVDQALAAQSFWNDVRDSKALSPGTRSHLALRIHQSAVDTSVAFVSAALVDDIGLTAANRCAMEQAVLGLRVDPNLLLIDAMTIDLDYPQLGLIDGDARSLSIAAASIVAKVARDEFMVELDEQFPAYGFARNKGYGVAAHISALAMRGSCEHHRKSFSPVRQFNGLDRGA